MKDDLPRYTLRVPQDLLDKLEYIAKFEARTKNKELEHMIRLRIQEFEKEHGPIRLKDLRQM
nr:hypothetical protein [uncultured Oscillibacter sp.]